MDGHDEAKKVKVLMYVTIAFLVSLYVSYGELAYLRLGKKTTAKLTKAYLKVSESDRTNEKSVEIKYKFAEPDGTHRIGSDSMPGGWRPKNWDPDMETGEVEIQFTPGEDGRSRVTGHVNWIGLVLFFVLLSVLGFQAFSFWREVQDAIKPSGEKRR